MKYRCSICGQEYNTVKERANCEIACAEKSEKAAEERRRKQLEAQKEARNKEINDKLAEAVELIVKYNKDYGEDPHIKFKSGNIDIDLINKKYNSTFERKTPSEIAFNRWFNNWLNSL